MRPPQQYGYLHPFPDKDASGIGSSTDAITGDWFIGVLLPHRACNGDCSYESSHFERACTGRPVDDQGSCTDDSKTAFRPYDFAVQGLLLIAKHHLQERIGVWSGGADAHWSDARILCCLHLGYLLLEFYLDGENGLIPRQDQA